MKRKIFSAIALLALISIALFGYFRYYYIVGEGVKAGHLNQVVHKGIMFKTYEGDVVQSGFNGKRTMGIQSYEFSFSIVDEDLAKQLMLESGKMVQLHYIEYMKELPWRGVSKYVVDSIVSIQ